MLCGTLSALLDAQVFLNGFTYIHGVRSRLFSLPLRVFMHLVMCAYIVLYGKLSFLKPLLWPGGRCQLAIFISKSHAPKH